MAVDKSKKLVKAKELDTVEKMKAELLLKQTELIAFKRSQAAEELTNPRVITSTRKQIARLHTSIRADEISKAKENK